MTNTSDIFIDGINANKGQDEKDDLLQQEEGHSMSSNDKISIDKHHVFDFAENEKSTLDLAYSRFKNGAAKGYHALRNQLKKLKTFWQTYPLFVSIGTFFVIIMLVAMW